MSIIAYQILHVASVFLLGAFTFMAAATASVGKNKAVLAICGVLSLLALVGGFGLLTRLNYGFPGWIMVKLAAWLFVSAGAGLAYRKPQKAGTIAGAVLVAIVTAICMVYLKPF